jgi:hypothetical protein
MKSTASSSIRGGIPSRSRSSRAERQVPTSLTRSRTGTGSPATPRIDRSWSMGRPVPAPGNRAADRVPGSGADRSVPGVIGTPTDRSLPPGSIPSPMPDDREIIRVAIRKARELGAAGRDLHLPAPDRHHRRGSVVSALNPFACIKTAILHTKYLAITGIYTNTSWKRLWVICDPQQYFWVTKCIFMSHKTHCGTPVGDNGRTRAAA